MEMTLKTLGVKVTQCFCCGKKHPWRLQSDPWNGRLNGYCEDCATNRCDCYPDECPNKDW